MDALSLELERLGSRGELHAARRCLGGPDVQARLVGLLGERLGGFPGADGSTLRELAERSIELALPKLHAFRAREHGDALAWLAALLRAEIEQRWFLGMERFLVAALRRRSPTLPDALLEEVAVQALGRAIERSASFDRGRGRLEAWVLAIAGQCLRARLRRRSPSLASELDVLPAPGAPLSELEARDLGSMLFGALRRCPRRERLVLRARLVGVEYAQIAERLGMGVASVHNLVCRVRGRLREVLEREERA